MMCDVEYANTEQSLVSLFDFTLPENTARDSPTKDETSSCP